MPAARQGAALYHARGPGVGTWLLGQLASQTRSCVLGGWTTGWPGMPGKCWPGPLWQGAAGCCGLEALVRRHLHWQQSAQCPALAYSTQPIRHIVGQGGTLRPGRPQNQQQASCHRWLGSTSGQVEEGCTARASRSFRPAASQLSLSGRSHTQQWGSYWPCGLPRDAHLPPEMPEH